MVVVIHRVRKKNGTNNVLDITLTKFNKFPQFLAQFMLTCQLTKKIIKSTVTTCTTLRNNYVSLTSSKCRFHKNVLVVEKWLTRSGCRLEWWVGWVQGWGSQTGLAIAPREGVQNTYHWSRRPQTSHQNSFNSVGQAGNLTTFRHCCSCASVASTSFSLCEGGGGHFEHCF